MPVLRYVEDLFGALEVPAPCDLPLALRCVKAARRMPLTHGLKSSGRHTDFLCKQPAELLSRDQRGAPPSKAQQFAETSDAVCFWVGPLRIPDRDAAVVFNAEIESPGTAATPWDSGGLLSHVGQHLSQPERRALFQRRTMPAPDYRNALAAAIYLRHGTPGAYLNAEFIRNVDPDNCVKPGDPSSFTFEARIPRRVRIMTKNLRYVAARRDAMSAGLHALRSWCREHLVTFDLIDERGRHKTVMDAVLAHFQDTVS